MESYTLLPSYIFWVCWTVPFFNFVWVGITFHNSEVLSVSLLRLRTDRKRLEWSEKEVEDMMTSFLCITRFFCLKLIKIPFFYSSKLLEAFFIPGETPVIQYNFWWVGTAGLSLPVSVSSIWWYTELEFHVDCFVTTLSINRFFQPYGRKRNSLELSWCSVVYIPHKIVIINFYLWRVRQKTPALC